MSINEYIAGAVGGVCGVVVGHPFDTTKIQMQIRTTGEHKLTKVADAWRSVVAQGLKNGVFRGMLFPVASYGVINSVFFGVYGKTIQTLEPDHTIRPTNLQVYLAGCVAGAVQLIFSCPVEVIKCTLQAQIPLTLPESGDRKRALYPKETVKPRMYYSGPHECVIDIFKSEGLGGFYKGFLTMFVRDVPGYGLYLLSYEWLHTLMIRYGLTDKNGLIPAIVAGGTAGCISWATIMPFDVIKSRLQTITSGFAGSKVDHGGRYRGMIDCFVKSVQGGGFSVLFRGTTLTLLRAFPVNAITFLVYSQMLIYLNYYNPPKTPRYMGVAQATGDNEDDSSEDTSHV